MNRSAAGSPDSGPTPDSTSDSDDGSLVGPAADVVFTALADPTRRRILQSLADRAEDAGALGHDLGISRQAAAKHLRILEGAGLVTATRSSRRRVHATDPARIREVSDLLGTVARGWERRLASVAAQAEADEKGTRRT
ncbi:ArsR/SmtB family transcription factor [Brevibacterium jeotgali]|uniref:Helix-turn-helix domain-containing protein n=1 Tax=Brevibacterium jeotgali TaxID=1262550 RepID=A0A2H1L552_9MICO|nr:metalloregulator ArsR/SmtB family transcription factor [Brevibacterium jeotgali]TWC01396.1 helix-turn-helix protein [Brevibacterium jeotgali]SMY11999.1 Helix-turn-helix domain-containing protein [Brevibacterium jeotgali]